LTNIPISVGLYLLVSSFSTYFLSNIVLVIVAYVDGLPIPFSSNSFINEASLYLAGGSVKCWFNFTSFNKALSPISNLGKIFSCNDR